MLRAWSGTVTATVRRRPASTASSSARQNGAPSAPRGASGSTSRTSSSVATSTDVTSCLRRVERVPAPQPGRGARTRARRRSASLRHGVEADGGVARDRAGARVRRVSRAARRCGRCVRSPAAGSGRARRGRMVPRSWSVSSGSIVTAYSIYRLRTPVNRNGGYTGRQDVAGSARSVRSRHDPLVHQHARFDPDVEHLATPAALTAWLADHDLAAARRDADRRPTWRARSRSVRRCARSPPRTPASRSSPEALAVIERQRQRSRLGVGLRRRRLCADRGGCRRDRRRARRACSRSSPRRPRRHLGAAQGVRRSELPVGVLRLVPQPPPGVVLDGGVRQPQQGARLPAAGSARTSRSPPAPDRAGRARGTAVSSADAAVRTRRPISRS